jgi:hypothetical protein
MAIRELSIKKSNIKYGKTDAEQMVRQTDRRTDRQTCRWRDIHTDSEMQRQTHTDRQIERQTHRHSDGQSTDRQTLLKLYNMMHCFD